MLIPAHTLKTVGFLDPTFRAPGWGADVDYSLRVSQAGLELYVSHRAMLWHHNGYGGLSAKEIYGSRHEWLRKGLEQVRADMKTKYGPNWREIIPVPNNEYDHLL